MKVYLDARTDLRTAGLPDSRADIEAFGTRYIEAAQAYAEENDLEIDVITDTSAPLDPGFDEALHTHIWQAIHNSFSWPEE